jgi:hypothetical protein
MSRLIVWHCDNCHQESRSESAGWLVVKEFKQDRPKFYSFCCWQCLSRWLASRRTPEGAFAKEK